MSDQDLPAIPASLSCEDEQHPAWLALQLAENTLIFTLKSTKEK